MTGIMFLKTGLKPEWLRMGLYSVEFGVCCGTSAGDCNLASFQEKLSLVLAFACPKALFYTSPFEGAAVSPVALGQALVIKELSLLYGFRAIEISALTLCHFCGNLLPDKRGARVTASCFPRFPGTNFPVCDMDCVCNGHRQQYIRRPEFCQMTVFQENC